MQGSEIRAIGLEVESRGYWVACRVVGDLGVPSSGFGGTTGLPWYPDNCTTL